MYGGKKETWKVWSVCMMRKTKGVRSSCQWKESFTKSMDEYRYIYIGTDNMRTYTYRWVDGKTCFGWNNEMN